MRIIIKVCSISLTSTFTHTLDHSLGCMVVVVDVSSRNMRTVYAMVLDRICSVAIRVVVGGCCLYVSVCNGISINKIRIGETVSHFVP